MTEEDTKAGCEEYLYKQQMCCLHPFCPVQDCPEPVCVFDFPGGMRAFLQQKEIHDLMDTGLNTQEIAEKLGLTRQSVIRRLNKTVV